MICGHSSTAYHSGDTSQIILEIVFLGFTCPSCTHPYFHDKVLALLAPGVRTLCSIYTRFRDTDLTLPVPTVHALYFSTCFYCHLYHVVLVPC